jgi:uncharacterized tellurite resistance protein B-like protein
MPLIPRLIETVADWVGRPRAAAETMDERLAAAALLVHVAKVDGRLAASEGERLRQLVAERFGLGSDAAARLVERAEARDREGDDIAAMIDVIGRDAPEAERRRLVAMAYAVAAADGVLAEFEDDLVWRLGRLLGFRDGEIAALRAEAGSPGPLP